jgi:DNA-binding CsgD family transcriptional regulator
MAAGKTARRIAAALGVSVRTVDAHRANIRHKLGVHSASQSALGAVGNGIV